ncbi:MAG TPA: hypothetical protein PK253_11940 [Spirochaetota bacterium]|nr:hypothetical protein [Spirochaetota bacterium]
MNGYFCRGLIILLLAGACVLRLNAEEPASFVVPETRYGQHILPDEKSLRNWKVYSTPIVLDRETLVKAVYRNDTPESAAVSFFSSIAKGNREYLSLLSPRIRPEIKKSIAVHSKTEGESFRKVQIFAKLETDVALTLEKTEGSFLANKDDMGKVVKHFGPFNVVIFFETPPGAEDGFLLLAKENTAWKILAVTGWLYRPGGHK